ncbi:MAG: hypothetical protein VKJ64_00660 [Leptolyngbyaceae bacterium]|nr:hypothetical protein [Leptolyngbyaceae bacterium]
MNLPIQSTASKSNRNFSPSLVTLANVWAKRYVRAVNQARSNPAPTSAADMRREIATILAQGLRTVSVQAWAKTESLLSEEVIRHQLAPETVDPWAISGDVYQIYHFAFESYARGVTPERFAVDVAPELGKIRAKFTAIEPRIIGFVSIQFHYTGQYLLNLVQMPQQGLLQQYFKAIDDHLYMPLERAYEAAASYDYGSPELNTIQTLLPQSSAIAKRVVHQVIQAFPNHQCYSGPLNSQTVSLSSTRDAEMFQTYIWVCVLEKSISSVQQELFPLCVMLYPTFNVRWEIVRYMLVLLEQEFATLLAPSEFALCAPYIDALKVMMAPDVFENVA